LEKVLQSLTQLKGPSSITLESLGLKSNITLPRYFGDIDDEHIDAWIQNVSMYFDSYPKMVNAMKLEWVVLNLDGIILE
jgi:hypothetical protein